MLCKTYILLYSFLYIKTLTLIPKGVLLHYQSEGLERISAPPGHVISQGSAPGHGL